MAADQLTDKEDQFKRRARRRLVGAVALVLLMVTVLPMVLDDRSNQKTPQPEIAISIPSQDGKDFTSRIIPVTQPPVAPPPAPIDMASPVEKPAEPPMKSKPGKASAAPKPVAQDTGTTENAPIAGAAEADKETPAIKPETAKPATVENKTKPPALKKGSVSVQIGVFSDAAKVKQMHAKIAEKGIHCYTENMDTPKGTKYRVRCGPFADKPSAQHALETLKATGFNGILVTNQ